MFVIRCGTTSPKGAPLYSAPHPTLEEAMGALVRWKQRDDWLTLEIWESDPSSVPRPRKPKCVHREERSGDGNH